MHNNLWFLYLIKIIKNIKDQVFFIYIKILANGLKKCLEIRYLN